MRLLTLCPFYPPHIGGLETHALEFNRHLAPSVDHITVFTPRLPLTAPIRETAGNITTLRFPAVEPIHNYPVPKFWHRHFWELWKEAMASKPTHILSRTRFFFTSLMAWRVARSQTLPWLHIEHGSDFVHFHSPLKSLLGRLYDYTFGRFVLSQADTIVANSEASNQFVSILTQNQSTVIHRGYEVNNILSATAPGKLQEQYRGKLVIGYLGRLIDGKGVHDLISAFGALKQKNTVCFIIGDGPDRAKLEALAEELNIKDRVTFFGHRPLPEALSIMQLFDVFVNPSYSEGLPTSVVEAALSKKAIIATAVGGTTEVLSGNNDGILIPPHQPSLLAEKLDLVLGDDALRLTLGTHAYERVSDRFSWERAIDRYKEIFSNLRVKD